MLAVASLPVAAQPPESDPEAPPPEAPAVPEAPITPAPAPSEPPPAPEAPAASPPPALTLRAAPASSPDDELPDYSAVGVAPAPGARIALDKLPSNVLRLDANLLTSQHAISLSDALNQRLGSVVVNDVQSNPLQPDVQYRGFTASPLLGTPQGISVYQNGVRLNEPFGEVTQWDLIPLFAISEVQVLPGTNPVYGLNTLGGSLIMRMKDGWSAPGPRVEGSVGSFSRYRTTAEYGKVVDGWGGYAGVSLFGEQGFRDHSPSTAQNLYADLRRRGPDYEVGVGLTLARTDLNGNGPSPVELLGRSRSAVYTWPDNTKNELVMVNVDAQKKLAERVAMQGTLYLRHLRRNTLNGDSAELSSCPGGDGEDVLCDEEGEPLTPAVGRYVPLAQAYDSVFNTTSTTTNGFGGSLQLSVTEPLGEHKNQLIVGASYDAAQTTFGQRTELGNLTAERFVEGGGPSLVGPGVQTDLFAVNHGIGVYAVDSFNIPESLALHGSARFNYSHVALNARLGDDLDGKHGFARVNPALGLTQRLGRAVTLFAGYGESSRAPSAAELACADPDEPCRLPNAFVSDPPLEQVVSRTAELGVRVHAGSSPREYVSGSLAVFGTRNFDDIIFISGERPGLGYFQNAGETQRVGLELALNGQYGPVGIYAGYTVLRATFESELTLPRNGVEDDDDEAEGGDEDAAEEEAEGGFQQVQPGDRIPGLPTHVVKAGVTFRITAPFEITIGMLGQSSQPFRGDEANDASHLRGWVALNAQASYRILPDLTAFVRAQNILDTQYSTFGVLANPAEVLPGTSNPRFQGPGAPFGIWAGIVLNEPR
ncbi:MAG: TonB-dependent receptor [Polyangiales bacterium]